MGTLVNAENIRGVYYTEGKDVVAVNDVSIKIEEGEVLGLAGESGSGKTTLGSIISLIARPPLHVEEGTLEIDGQVQELGGHAKIPRTWRGAVVSMLPQGAMNSISPTKRIRNLVYDVMRSAQLTDEPALKTYHLLPSVRGDLLKKLGRIDEARVEFERAASLAGNARERELLLERAAAARS